MPSLVLWQIEGSKNNVPEGDAYTEVTPVSQLVVVRKLGGVMPAVHFRSVEEIVQPPAFHIAAAVRELPVRTKDARDDDRKRIKADDAKHKTSQDIPERPLERIGNQHIGNLYVGDTVVVAVEFP